MSHREKIGDTVSLIPYRMVHTVWTIREGLRPESVSHIKRWSDGFSN